MNCRSCYANGICEIENLAILVFFILNLAHTT